MNIFRFLSPLGPRLGLDLAGERYDLSAVAPQFADVSTWLSSSDRVAAVLSVPAASRSFPIPDAPLLPPLDVQEVWACGVTYLRSKVARMEESKAGGDFYDRVYEAARPEIFFQSNPSTRRGAGKTDSHPPRFNLECARAGTGFGSLFKWRRCRLHDRQRCVVAFNRRRESPVPAASESL